MARAWVSVVLVFVAGCARERRDPPIAVATVATASTGSTASTASTASTSTAAPAATGARIALLVGAFPRSDAALRTATLARARGLGFDARDDVDAYDRWGSTSLFFGEVDEPPRWVDPELARIWRAEGAKCPKMPARDSPARTEEAASAAYQCTQTLLTKLRELDLERQQPAVLLMVGAGPEESLGKPTGRWYAWAKAGRTNDPCIRTLGAGAESSILVPLRDAEAPKDEACAVATAVSLAGRLLEGERGDPMSRGGVSLRVIGEECDAGPRVEVAEREAKKTPAKVCP